MNILTLSSVFPSPAYPSFGAFIRMRQMHVGAAASVRVLAPVPLLDYRLRKTRFRSDVPLERQDENLTVYQPRWFYLPGAGFLNAGLMFLQMLPTTLRLDREARIDLIDSHFAHPDGIAAALLARFLNRPFTVTLRGNETLHGSFRFRRMAMGWALRRAAAVITVSEPLRKYAISLGVAPARIKTIPNGVDVSIFHTRSDLSQVRKHVVLSAGYLIERKGFHRLIRAVAALRARGVACELEIAGGPGGETAHEGALHRMVGELGLENAVRFLGPVAPAGLAELMSRAGVFCLASSREGWPNVVHEALACGAPVVAADVGGVRDLIPSPDYGMVVPAGDQPALEQGLEAALQKNWARDSIARWGQSRSWEKVSAEVLDLFDKVARNRVDTEVSDSGEFTADPTA
jgi:teichuronic acid biosynthesis glycosyltransferase TuaC